jgi:hypothetical protein
MKSERYFMMLFHIIASTCLLIKKNFQYMHFQMLNGMI